MTEKATLAGGCFWGVEDLLRKLDGVIDTTVGYTGGTLAKPRYEDVKTGRTGHAESIQIEFDPKKISYDQILEFFFRLHDPTTLNQQGNDRGTQYRSAIFYHSATQKKLAEETKAAVEKKLGRAYTDILPASEFWRAEEYHQHYYKKNPVRYHFYRFNCGRDQRLAAVWGR